MKRQRPVGDDGPDGRPFARRLLRNALLWLPAVVALWWLLTPYYNFFLTVGTERLIRLGERPGVTRLVSDPPHGFSITRTDFPPARGALAKVNVTDVQFPAILLVALFLAVPGVPARKKLENLATALVVAACFHVVNLFLWVKFIYAYDLGAWSEANYGPVARELWGITKHVVNLPFKLGLPLLLWAAFYLRRLLPERAG